MVRLFAGGLAIFGLALAVLGFAGTLASASCAQQSQGDQLTRADVVAYGRVTSVDRGAGTINFRALIVYKGDPGPNALRVQIGPGPRGIGAATSVDYRADPGDHLLYLQKQGSTYETNDCSGSHPGPATADELRVLSASGAKVITYPDPGPDVIGQLAAPMAAAVIAAVVASFGLYRRRGTSV